MEPDWNELAGELRSALAARNWGEAGAVVWRLRQLDQERYTLELEHYTNQQVGKGGRGVALETEQRLEAVRQWAYQVLALPDTHYENPWPDYLNKIVRGEDRPSANYLADEYGNWSPHLMWRLTSKDGRTAYTLRQDMADVIWSILVETEKLEG